MKTAGALNLTAPRRVSLSSGWASGVGIGLAIYSGMFVVAGAWRSDEVAIAVQAGKATAAGVALHSFQVAAADSATSVRVALASATPTARFVEPQRVSLAYAPVPASALPAIKDGDVTVEDDYIPAPIPLHPIDGAHSFSSELSPVDLTTVIEPVAIDDGLRSTL